MEGGSCRALWAIAVRRPAQPGDDNRYCDPWPLRKAGPGPVTYTPAIALGLTTPNRGGWYLPAADGGQPRKSALWTYTFKNTADDLKPARICAAAGGGLANPLRPRRSTVRPLGFNDDFTDGGVFTEPALVARINRNALTGGAGAGRTR